MSGEKKFHRHNRKSFKTKSANHLMQTNKELTISIVKAFDHQPLKGNVDSLRGSTA